MARVKWGSPWRMPTKKEFEELLKNCDRKWTTLNGVNGYRVTGKNGNSIFLPAAGRRYGTSLHNAVEYGNFWSSSPDYWEDNNIRAWCLDFGCVYRGEEWSDRSNGFSIRPVINDGKRQ